MNRRFLAVLVLVVGGSFSLSAADEGKLYSIISDTESGRVKRSVDVRLVEKVAEEELRKIAGEIKAMKPTKFERTFILYYLPEQKVGAGAWASSHYNPELKIQILGTPKEPAGAAQAKAPDGATEVIGRWDYSAPPGIVFVLYRTKTGFTLQYVFSKESTLEKAVTAKRDGEKVVVRPVEPGGSRDYWILDEEKNLVLMDADGVVGKAVAIKEK